MGTNVTNPNDRLWLALQRHAALRSREELAWACIVDYALRYGRQYSSAWAERLAVAISEGISPLYRDKAICVTPPGLPDAGKLLLALMQRAFNGCNAETRAKPSHRNLGSAALRSALLSFKDTPDDLFDKFNHFVVMVQHLGLLMRANLEEYVWLHETCSQLPTLDKPAAANLRRQIAAHIARARRASGQQFTAALAVIQKDPAWLADAYGQASDSLDLIQAGVSLFSALDTMRCLGIKLFTLALRNPNHSFFQAAEASARLCWQCFARQLVAESADSLTPPHFNPRPNPAPGKGMANEKKQMQ